MTRHRSRPDRPKRTGPKRARPGRLSRLGQLGRPGQLRKLRQPGELAQVIRRHRPSLPLALGLASVLALSVAGYGFVRVVGSGSSGDQAASVPPPGFAPVAPPPAPPSDSPFDPPTAPADPPGTASPEPSNPPTVKAYPYEPPQAKGYGPYLNGDPGGQRPPYPTQRFVSDLSFTRADNGLGPVERDRSNGTALAGDGRTLTIHGIRFARGLGVHADSDVQIVLGGRCTRFSAKVGVDDESRTDGFGDGTRVVFAVFADGKLIYRSPDLDGNQAARPVDLDVTGANRLDLVVDDLGYAFGDHADWADARITCRD